MGLFFAAVAPPTRFITAAWAEAVVRGTATDSRSCTCGGGKGAIIRTVSKELSACRMSWNFCIPRKRKWDAGDISSIFIPPNPLFFSFFFILLEYSRRIVITVSLCNSIILATDIWGADIINLFLVHLRMPWDILQVSSSADTFVPQGEFIHCHKSLTLNILIDMFQESLNKLCWESLVNNSSSKRKQTLLEKVCIVCNSRGELKKITEIPGYLVHYSSCSTVWILGNNEKKKKKRER